MKMNLKNVMTTAGTVICLFASLLSTPASAAQFARALDVSQGFNFKKDKQTPVGFITEMQIGGLVLKADLESIKDPESPDKALATKVVAVLNHYSWATGVGDAVYLSGQLSTPNKQAISSALLGAAPPSLPVIFKYVIYEYDPLQKKYFKSNTSDVSLKGIVERNGKDINISVADDSSNEVQSPKNFAFQIGIRPAPVSQSVNLAVGGGKKLVKQWGIAGQ